MINEIRVEGLRDFQRELRIVDANLPRELRRANLDAAEIIARGTRASFSSRRGVAPKVAKTVRAQAQQRSASVKIGGVRAPYAFGAEFGGRARPTTQQFEPYIRLGRGGRGYSLYPTIREKTDEVVNEYGQAVDKLMRRVFPD